MSKFLTMLVAVAFLSGATVHAGCNSTSDAGQHDVKVVDEKAPVQKKETPKAKSLQKVDKKAKPSG